MSASKYKIFLYYAAGVKKKSKDKVFYKERVPQRSINYHCLRGQLSTILTVIFFKLKKVKSSTARSLPVENLLSQNVGSIINYLQ